MSNTTVRKYHPHDFILEAQEVDGNPFMVELTASFKSDSGATVKGIRGFCCGDGVWKVRFAPPEEGAWTGVTSSIARELDGVELGPVTCAPSDNPLVHGVLKVNPQYPHRFQWQDGKPFVPLGFECDWLFALHQKDPRECRRAVDLISERGFNYIVMNVYAHTGFSDPALEGVLTPPRMFVFGGSSEEPGHSVLNPEFFEDFDALISCLHQKGIVSHLMIQVQNKKVKWPERRSAEDDMYWRYVVSRYQAFGNIVWDVGKESYYFLRETGSHDYTLERIDLIRNADAYGHCVTVHDPVSASQGVNSVVDEACDFVSDQVHLGDAVLYNHETQKRFHMAGKPYMNIEYGYELGVEELKTYISRTTAGWRKILVWTWAIYLGGGYPCYYYNNTSWDLVRFLPEPPGWKRYRYLVDFLAQFDLNPMTPRNELVREGFCLAEEGRQYLAFLPQGGDLTIDLTSVDKDTPVRCEWLDAFSGEKASCEIEDRHFAAVLENPLTEKGNPCAIWVRREC